MCYALPLHLLGPRLPEQSALCSPKGRHRGYHAHSRQAHRKCLMRVWDCMEVTSPRKAFLRAHLAPHMRLPPASLSPIAGPYACTWILTAAWICIWLILVVFVSLTLSHGFVLSHHQDLKSLRAETIFPTSPVWGCSVPPTDRQATQGPRRPWAEKILSLRTVRDYIWEKA